MSDRAPPRTTESPAPLPRPRSLDEALDRLQSLETRLAVYVERTNQRLNSGSETMAEMKHALGDLKPKSHAVIPWVAVAIAIGGIVFRAGNYPDRNELEVTRDRVVEQVQALRGEVSALRLDLVRACSGPLQAIDKRVDELRVSLDRTAERSRRKP